MSSYTLSKLWENTVCTHKIEYKNIVLKIGENWIWNFNIFFKLNLCNLKFSKQEWFLSVRKKIFPSRIPDMLRLCRVLSCSRKNLYQFWKNASKCSFYINFTFWRNIKAVYLDIAVFTYITFFNKMAEYWWKWEFSRDLKKGTMVEDQWCLHIGEIRNRVRIKT